MSLGLNDLKKHAPQKTSQKKSETKSATGSGAVSENWARTSRTARPWTSSGLTKGPKGRTSPVASDAHMNSEWANEHTASLQAFDMEVQSALTQIRDLQISMKEQAVELERKIKRAAMSPFHIARQILRAVKA